MSRSLYTLSLDTSTTTGSVALFEADRLIFSENFMADRSHGSALFALLESARRLAGQIDTVAVGLGPGSYAGIRISISAAIGFQIGSGSALVGIPSVAALDCGLSQCVVIGDARRETYYYTSVDDGVCVEGPMLLGEPELREKLSGQRAEAVFASAPVPQFPGVSLAVPSAEILGRLAIRRRGIVAEGSLEPMYLREAHITQPRQKPPSV